MTKRPARGTVSLTTEPPVATVTFSRPPVNALDVDTIRAIETRVKEASGDARIKLLAIAGAGADFCAGTDIAQHAEPSVRELLPAFHDLVRALLESDVPTAALVQGRALGGGAELALACDFVFAETTATLGFPEITLGVFPPVAAVLLERRLGRARAADLILSGAAITAEKAERRGLVNALVPPGELSQALETMSDRFARLSASSLRRARRALSLGASGDPLSALQRVEQLYLGDLMQTADAHEGIAAFLEKRAPRWKHR